jgi:transcriptional regulator with XRE-family HTH domain
MCETLKMAQKRSDMVRTRFKPSHRTFIREWRKYRGHTLEELAEIMGVSAGALSNVETMKSGYTQGMLEELAKALACTEADLLGRDPNQAPGLNMVLDKATEAQRKQIENMAQILVFGKAA